MAITDTNNTAATAAAAAATTTADDDDAKNRNNGDNNNSTIDDRPITYKAKTTVWDYPLLLFGGEMTFNYGNKTTETYVFPNAFQLSLCRDRLQRAKEKCGYMPCTKVLLNSDRLRHEVLEGQEENKKDAKTVMLELLEKSNTEAFEFLVEYGFDIKDVKTLKKKIKTVTKVQQEARTDITQPHTFDRRQKIMNAKHPGDYFKMGIGGIAYNHDDCIIAHDMKRIFNKQKSLERKKTHNLGRVKQIEDAEEVVSRKGSNVHIGKWTIPEVKKLIKWKQPKIAVSSKSKEELVVIWDDVKDLIPPGLDDTIPVFTEADQKLLDEYKKDGKFDIARCYVMRRAERRKKRTLKAQILTLQPRNQVKVLGSILQDLDDSDRRELLDNWKQHDIEDDYSLSETSSIGSDDEPTTTNRGQQRRGRDRQPRQPQLPLPLPPLQQQQQQQNQERSFELEDDDDDNDDDDKHDGWDSGESESSEEESLVGPQGNDCFSSDDNVDNNETVPVSIYL